MRNKILKGIILIVLGLMLITLTGCEDGTNLSQLKGSDNVAKNATEAKKKHDINSAKDAVMIEIDNLLSEFYMQPTQKADTALDYIKNEIGKGKMISNSFYLVIEEKNVVVYKDNTKSEEIVSGKIDKKGKITWNN